MSGLWKAKGGAQPRGEEENLELLEVIQSARGKKYRVFLALQTTLVVVTVKGYDPSGCPLPSVPCHSIKHPEPIVCYIFQLDLTDGENFWVMEWSIILERHPLDSIEWRWF